MKALLQYKIGEYYPDDIIVDAVETLSDAEFTAFCRAPLRDYDFIQKHISDMCVDHEGTHCLAVVSQTGQDAVLVESEGYPYARYSAYVPGGKLAFTMTPTLARELNHCAQAVEYIVQQGEENIGYTELYRRFDLDLGFDCALANHVCDSLCARKEVLHVENTGESFLVAYTPEFLQMQEQETKPSLGQTL